MDISTTASIVTIHIQVIWLVGLAVLLVLLALFRKK